MRMCVCLQSVNYRFPTSGEKLNKNDNRERWDKVKG